MGEESADLGSVQFDPPGLRVGYLPQGLKPADDDTLGDYLGRWRDDMEELSKELESLAVVHDWYFIAGYATEIWEIKGQSIFRL